MSIPYNFNPLGFDLEKTYVLPIKNGYGMYEHINNPSFGVLVVDNDALQDQNIKGWKVFTLLPLDFSLILPSGDNTWWSVRGLRSWYPAWLGTGLRIDPSIDFRFEKKLKIKSIDYYGTGAPNGYGWFGHTLELYGTNDDQFDSDYSKNTLLGTCTFSPGYLNPPRLLSVKLEVDNPGYFYNYRIRMIKDAISHASSMTQIKLNAVFK